MCRKGDREAARLRRGLRPLGQSSERQVHEFVPAVLLPGLLLLNSYLMGSDMSWLVITIDKNRNGFI